MQLSGVFLDVAACPACRGKFAADFEAETLNCVNPACQLSYPVIDNIPMLTAEHATRVTDAAD
ncbi:MAG: hypothetical protein CR980_00510 [Propionibacteriales bacterium]|nr:MAG: hypothetical protein CR980_00510 [Propionibacteriales bacterium]